MKIKARYLRQAVLPEIGEEGQNKLRNSTALIIGCGGLASPVLTYLASAGVGTIILVDEDRIEDTDLNRQFLYEEKQLGEDKCSKAKEFLEQRNSEISIKSIKKRIDFNNAEEILRGAQVVIDCVDNDETRVLVSRSCNKLHIPLIEGGILGFYGYVLPILPGVSACMECLKGDIEIQEKEGLPVIGATAGIIGSIQAMEALKVLLELNVNYGMMLEYDGLHSEFTSIPVKPRSDCNCRQKF